MVVQESSECLLLALGIASGGFAFCTTADSLPDCIPSENQGELLELNEIDHAACCFAKKSYTDLYEFPKHSDDVGKISTFFQSVCNSFRGLYIPNKPSKHDTKPSPAAASPVTPVTQEGLYTGSEAPKKVSSHHTITPNASANGDESSQHTANPGRFFSFLPTRQTKVSGSRNKNSADGLRRRSSQPTSQSGTSPKRKRHSGRKKHKKHKKRSGKNSGRSFSGLEGSDISVF